MAWAERKATGVWGRKMEGSGKLCSFVNYVKSWEGEEGLWVVPVVWKHKTDAMGASSAALWPSLF